MSLIRRNTDLLPGLWNDVFTPDWFGGVDSNRSNLPAVNIMEGEKDFTLELAVPGQKKEDFNVELDNDVLTISMETQSQVDDKKAGYTRREFSYTSFKRAFTLPESVNQEDIKADYKDGILKFTLPKKEEALPKAKRLIEIGK